MRHFKFPVAIAIGLAVAIAAGGTVSAKSTQKAKPSAATTQAKLMAEHRGGTLKLLAKAAGGSLDPQVNYTLEYWQLYRFTQDGLVTFKAARFWSTRSTRLVPGIGTMSGPCASNQASAI